VSADKMFWTSKKPAKRTLYITRWICSHSQVSVTTQLGPLETDPKHHRTNTVFRSETSDEGHTPLVSHTECIIIMSPLCSGLVVSVVINIQKLLGSSSPILKYSEIYVSV
jgi:hypothetical protein